LQEQALFSTASSQLSWLSSTRILTPSSTLFSLKKTRSDNENGEESESPTAKRPRPNTVPKLSQDTNLEKRYEIHGYGKPQNANTPRLHSATKPKGKRKHRDQRTPGAPPPTSRIIRPSQQPATAHAYQLSLRRGAQQQKKQQQQMSRRPRPCRSSCPNLSPLRAGSRQQRRSSRGRHRQRGASQRGSQSRTARSPPNRCRKRPGPRRLPRGRLL
jgi:hypothetical protein